MDTRLGDLTVEQFTALLIRVVSDIVDEKITVEKTSGDTEEIRKIKIGAIKDL